MTNEEDAQVQKIFALVDSAMRIAGYPVDSDHPEMKAWVRGARYRMAREMWDPTWCRIKDYRSKVYSMLFKKHRKTCAWMGENRITKTCDKLCGCGWQHMRDHIEGQFKSGMTWANHGQGKGKWSLDHIRPISAFDWWTDEGLKEAFHWSNSQPLWNDEHRAKSNRDNKDADMRRVTDPEYARRLIPSRNLPPLVGTNAEIMAQLERQLAPTP